LAYTKTVQGTQVEPKLKLRYNQIMNNQTDQIKNDTEHPWLTNHAHDPNPEPPSQDPTFQLRLPSGQQSQIDLPLLHNLPPATVPDCYIISTGHGTSGPFNFRGVKLDQLIEHCSQKAVQEPDQRLGQTWDYADVISVDGFGTRIFAHEVQDIQAVILLAYEIDGEEMIRAQGLVRLIVPSEQDDALRQVKWVARVELHALET